MTRIYKTTFLAVALMVLVIGSVSAGNRDHGGWLGVYMQSIDYELAETFELPVEYGVIVNRVIDDSPAEKAGFRDEDIIIAVDDKKITDSDDLIYFLEDMEDGDKIEVTIFRDGKEQKLSVVLGDKPDHDFEFFGTPRSPRAPRVPNVPRILGNFKNMHHGGSSSYIGVSLNSLTEQLGEYFGVDDGEGALISEVEKDSPAEKGGLKAGDVIIAVAGRNVDDYDDLIRAIRKSKPGDEVDITIVRDRSKKEMKIEVGERDSDSYGFYYHDDDDVFSLGDWSGNWSHWFDDDENVIIDRSGRKSDLRELERELEKMKEELEKVKKRLN